GHNVAANRELIRSQASCTNWIFRQHVENTMNICILSIFEPVRCSAIVMRQLLVGYSSVIRRFCVGYASVIHWLFIGYSLVNGPPAASQP
ncbi:MAG TPA: hypothetical protein VIF60_01765, partial [Burkholderiaceae bacterium]